MGEVFISYKQEERDRMRPIADGLAALGVDIWFDERLQPDRSFTDEIQHLIQDCRAQLVCWSPAAVGSEWVRGEAEKGRQRGVLVAVMIEPCDLPPPFNMHHAESLVGWTGDARHNGWRKVCDAIGRKIDRPGLGELAALQGSTDSGAWKKWAQKFPNDPFSDAAWAKAEELEIGAARERMARERDGAKRAAEEAERKRAAAAVAATAGPATASVTQAPLPPPPASSHSKSERKGNPLAIALGVGVVGAIAAAVFLFMMPRDSGTTEEAAEQSEQSTAATEAWANDCAALERSWDDVRYSAGRAEVQGYFARARLCPEVRADVSRRLAAMPAETPVEEAAPARIDPPARVERPPPDNRYASLSAEQQWREGHRYLIGSDGYTRNHSEAATLLRLSAQRGFAAAQSDLGYMYEHGLGVSANLAEAVRLYRLAASQNHVDATFNLGVMYASGRGVPLDRAEAVRLYRLSADQSYPNAQYALGYMYENGFGVSANSTEAVRWYRLAAQQNFQEAQNSLTRLGQTW